MRETPHSPATRVRAAGLSAAHLPAAQLPATSAIATAVLTVAWWLTLIGLTTPTVPHIGVAVTSAAVGAAIVAVASQPQMRSMLSQWVFRPLVHGRSTLPPGVTQRWTRAHHSARTPVSAELALMRVARPRAPGQGFVTA